MVLAELDKMSHYRDSLRNVVVESALTHRVLSSQEAGGTPLLWGEGKATEASLLELTLRVPARMSYRISNHSNALERGLLRPTQPFKGPAAREEHLCAFPRVVIRKPIDKTSLPSNNPSGNHF